MSHWGRLAGLTFLLSVVAYACGGKTNMADSACEPGATTDCSDGCQGQRVCLADGSGWSECSCGAGGSGYGGSGYGGSPYGGGYGGSVYGGSGGTGSGGSSYGGTGAVGSCDDECPSYKLAGLLDMEACCAPADACGAYMTSTVGAIVSLPEGCYPINQPGVLDNHCPDFEFVNPINGEQNAFPGCCRPSGLCGVEVDFTSADGPYLGCSDVGTSSGSEPCGSGNECSSCILSNCQNEVSYCLAESGCSDILVCAQTCFDLACVDKCIQSAPGGASTFGIVLGCANQKCFAECPALFGD